MLAATLLALSIIGAAPSISNVQSATVSEPDIAAMAINYCTTFVTNETDLRRCIDLQEEAYKDIVVTLALSREQGKDLSPVLVYCLEEEFIAANQLDLVAVRSCMVDVLARSVI